MSHFSPKHVLFWFISNQKHCDKLIDLTRSKYTRFKKICQGHKKPTFTKVAIVPLEYVTEQPHFTKLYLMSMQLNSYFAFIFIEYYLATTMYSANLKHSDHEMAFFGMGNE